MVRGGGRVVALTAALVAGLLVEAAPATAASTVVASPLVAPAVAGPTSAGTPTPAQAAQTAFGPVGSLVVAVGTSVSGDAARPVPTASIIKLHLAEGVLAASRAAGSALPAADLARVEAMLTSSDDTAASELWVRYDGPAVLADVVIRYGLTGTTAPAPDPGAWGSSRTSADDLVRFLTALPEVAHPDDAELVLDALGRATPTAADGFDQAFGLLSPAVGDAVAVKQGWMCCTDGVRHLHSVGVVAGRVVVLLAEFPVEVDWTAARAALDAAATAATAVSR